VIFFLVLLFSISTSAGAQIPPPGYERYKAMEAERNKMSPLQRDSVTLVDTVSVFDPTTYEETVSIIISRYSQFDYCKNFLGLNDPNILLDGKPHTVTNPVTYEDLIIRYNERGKIDTIPPK
jgi:hypothetical protein